MCCGKKSEKNSSAHSRIRVTSVARVHNNIIRKSSALQINSYPDVEHRDEESMR